MPKTVVGPNIKNVLQKHKGDDGTIHEEDAPTIKSNRTIIKKKGQNNVVGIIIQ